MYFINRWEMYAFSFSMLGLVGSQAQVQETQSRYCSLVTPPFNMHMCNK